MRLYLAMIVCTAPAVALPGSVDADLLAMPESGAQSVGSWAFSDAPSTDWLAIGLSLSNGHEGASLSVSEETGRALDELAGRLFPDADGSTGTPSTHAFAPPSFDIGPSREGVDVAALDAPPSGIAVVPLPPAALVAGAGLGLLGLSRRR
jgi:hypothetical protein